MSQKIYLEKKNGVGFRQLAKHYGVSVTTIYSRLREYCKANNLEIPKVKSGRKKIKLEE